MPVKPILQLLFQDINHKINKLIKRKKLKEIENDASVDRPFALLHIFIT